ncbi:MAG: di-heme oxidoredictase family protein [Pseudomonadota bacterium]
MPAAILESRAKLDFWVGFAFFRDPWVSAPSSTTARDGLGPLFNAHSCIACHVVGGRGDSPRADAATPAVILKVGAVGDATGNPHPYYGHQLQTRGTANSARPEMAGEAQLRINYEPRKYVLRDGSELALAAPQYRLAPPTDRSLPTGGDAYSPRIAPPLFGLGLLEAIPTARLRELADPNDANGDGISGRIRWLSAAPGDAPQVGRFGWKSTHASVAQQTATAFAEDMGITSALFASEPCAAMGQLPCEGPSAGDDPHEGVEITAGLFDRVVHFVSHLAPPAPPPPAADVVRGEGVFARLGCDGCHTPSHLVATATHWSGLRALETIWPYTDLLLHDMGPGLASDLPEEGAAGAEWRTPALWGLGANLAANPDAGLLHDGRARTVPEAIAWHGGEGEQAAQAFLSLNRYERDALVAFIKAL